MPAGLKGAEDEGEALRAFRERVMGDQGLLRGLCGQGDAGRFAARAVELGGRLGYVFSEAAVREALGKAARSWSAGP